MEELPKAFACSTDTDGAGPPMVVMLSSAGITRTAWDQQKKDRLVGASDIPIVRLNPMGVLEKKVVAEQKLREYAESHSVYTPVAGALGNMWFVWPGCRREWRRILHRPSDRVKVRRLAFRPANP